MNEKIICKECKEEFNTLRNVTYHSEKYKHHEFECPELNISLLVG